MIKKVLLVLSVVIFLALPVLAADTAPGDATSNLSTGPAPEDGAKCWTVKIDVGRTNTATNRRTTAAKTVSASVPAKKMPVTIIPYPDKHPFANKILRAIANGLSRILPGTEPARLSTIITTPSGDTITESAGMNI